MSALRVWMRFDCIPRTLRAYEHPPKTSVTTRIRFGGLTEKEILNEMAENCQKNISPPRPPARTPKGLGNSFNYINLQRQL
jgi:hypothetical protein